MDMQVKKPRGNLIHLRWPTNRRINKLLVLDTTPMSLLEIELGRVEVRKNF